MECGELEFALSFQATATQGFSGHLATSSSFRKSFDLDQSTLKE